MSTSSQIRKKAKEQKTQEKQISNRRKEGPWLQNHHGILWLIQIGILALTLGLVNVTKAFVLLAYVYSVFLLVLLILGVCHKAGKLEDYLGYWCYVVPAGLGVYGVFRYTYVAKSTWFAGFGWNNLYFWVVALIIGICSILYQLRKWESRKIKRKLDRARIVLAAIGLAMLITLGGAPLLNEALPGTEEVEVSYSVIESKAAFGIGNTSYILQDEEGNQLDATIKEDDYLESMLENGQSIPIRVKKGVLGSVYVDHLDQQVKDHVRG